MQKAIWAAVAILLVAVTLHQIVLFPEPRFSIVERTIGAAIVLACAVVAGYVFFARGVERVVVDSERRTVTKTSDATIDPQGWSVSFGQIDHISIESTGLLKDAHSVNIVASDGTVRFVNGNWGVHLEDVLFGIFRKEFFVDMAKKISIRTGKRLVSS